MRHNCWTAGWPPAGSTEDGMSEQNTGELPTIDSRGSFIAALKWGFRTAMAQRARRIVCVDGELVLWPLDDEELLRSLTTWLRLPQRRLVLLARSYDELPRSCPRFT